MLLVLFIYSLLLSKTEGTFLVRESRSDGREVSIVLYCNTVNTLFKEIVNILWLCFIT